MPDIERRTARLIGVEFSADDRFVIFCFRPAFLVAKSFIVDGSALSIDLFILNNPSIISTMYKFISTNITQEGKASFRVRFSLKGTRTNKFFKTKSEAFAFRKKKLGF